MIALASATGQARTLPASRTTAGGMVPCSTQFLMLPVLRSSNRPSSVIFTTAPRSAATAGLAFSSSRSSSKSQSPEHLVERVELVAPAVAAEVGGVLGALLDIVGDAAAGSAAASGAEAAGGADAIAELAPLALAAF